MLFDVANTIDCITGNPLEWYRRGYRACDHPRRKLWFGRKAGIGGHVCGFQAIWIGGPFLRKIQRAVDERMTTARNVGSEDSDLAVRNLACRTRVLPRHSARRFALFEKAGLVDHQHCIVIRQMLDDIVAHDIAQGISVPIPTPQNCLLPPWARIASRLRPLPTGLARLISEQTFQEQARIRRHTLLREQPPTTQASPQSTLLASTTSESWLPMDSEISQRSNCNARRSFIGGSDARIIMGDDEPALLRLWREKCGEVEPEDLSGNLIVQLGAVTEQLNRHWYERNTGQVVTEVQRQVFHPVKRWMAATLDGIVEGSGAVFEAKFMLPWSFSEEAAAEKHMPQLQHNMWVTASRTAVLSIITGGGKWLEMTIPADPLYQHLLLTAEKRFWRCVETGEAPHLFGVEPPKPGIEAVRTVDMSGSNAWAEFAGMFQATR